MTLKSLWSEFRYCLFLIFSLSTCIVGFFIGTIELPFLDPIITKITIPLFTISILLVTIYTLVYNLYYRESGIVTFILSLLFIAYPFIEFRFGIILFTLQSSLVLLAYGIGLSIGSGISIILEIYEKSEELREYMVEKSQNIYKV